MILNEFFNKPELDEARNDYYTNRTGFKRGARDPEGQDPAPDTRTWYIRLNGKLIRDKAGNPYSFRDKAAANNAALTMQAKLFNKGKEFVLTTNPNDNQQGVAEEKTRLDPKCWTGKKIGNPKTKVKGGVRVNNCVPAESIEESKQRCMQCGMVNCSCPGDSCKCKPIAGWIPGKGFKNAMDKEAQEKNKLDEVSTELLARYKTGAAADAKKADAAGDYKRGDKRFGGIVKATNKQFVNDLKKHSGVAEGNSNDNDGTQTILSLLKDFVKTREQPEDRKTVVGIYKAFQQGMEPGFTALYNAWEFDIDADFTYFARDKGVDLHAVADQAGFDTDSIREGVAEAGTLDRYRDRLGTTGNLQNQNDINQDRQQRRHDRNQDWLDANHQSSLNRFKDRDKMDAARTQHEIDVLAHRLSRMQRDDDDWEKTFDMMRDRINRYQWSGQRDVNPEQLAAISNIKYEPKNESAQAKTNDELLAYYAQRKAEKEKQGTSKGGQVHGQPEWQKPRVPKVNIAGKPLPQSLQQKLDNKKQQQGVTEGEQRVDSLVTDALKIMQGAEVGDAINALKTVLGDREYNGRRGHYNFYVRQLMDMYGQQGVTEADMNRRGFLRGLGAAAMAGAAGGAMAQSNQQQDLGNGFVLTTIDVAGHTVKAVLDTQSGLSFTLNRGSNGSAIIRSQARFLTIKDGKIVDTSMSVGPATTNAMKKAGLVQEGVAEGLDDNVPADRGEYDQEGEMAQQDLTTAVDAAEELRSILSADENLPEWVQAKITKAVDYLDTTRDYMKSKEPELNESRLHRLNLLKTIMIQTP